MDHITFACRWNPIINDRDANSGWLVLHNLNSKSWEKMQQKRRKPFLIFKIRSVGEKKKTKIDISYQENNFELLTSTVAAAVTSHQLKFIWDFFILRRTHWRPLPPSFWVHTRRTAVFASLYFTGSFALRFLLVVWHLAQNFVII